MFHTKQSFFQKPSNSVILNLIENQSKNILPISPSPRVERVGVRLAFTLVELIVVIVILAILATIAFLSFNSYSSSSRDSVRLADVNNFSKSLELYQIKTGSYPSPDNSFTITYSGGLVWYQGTLGDTLTRKLGNLSKKVVDPLSNTEYTYSLLSSGNSYQIKANYEGDSLSYNNLLPHLIPAYRQAGPSNLGEELSKTIPLTKGELEGVFGFNQISASNGNPKLAYIKGNYQGIVTRTTTGSMICILAIPSIITNTGSSGNSYEIGNNTLSGTLLYHGQSNTNGLYFNPNKVVYCSTSLPTNDTNSGLTNIASGIINAYSGTIITNINPTVQTIVNTPTSQLSTLGGNIVSGQLGGGVSGGSNQSVITASDPYWSSVKLLLHMDGSNGSTSFNDSSSFNSSITNNSSVIINTGTYKIGSASAYFSTTNYLTVPYNASLIPGSGDWTIEFWYYPIGTPGLYELYSHGRGIQIYTNGTAIQGNISASNNNSYFIASSFGNLTINSWNHIALVRNGNTYKGYLNGVGTTLGTSASSPNTGTDVISVGGFYNGSYLSYGYFDEVRYTKGVARYVNDFTPSIIPFPNN